MHDRFTLTGEQNKAIGLMPEHNVQLIACAGSGKTEIISRGIADIIRRGTKPTEIVAFTFTEKAAEELKARIRQVLQREQPERADLGDMYVGTIHSYCFEQLKELAPEYRSYDVLDDASRVAYVSKPANYYRELGLSKLEATHKVGRYTVISRFIDSVDIVLNEDVGAKRLKRLEPDLAASIDAYRTALKEDRYLDFSTMIHDLVILLETKKPVRAELRKRTRYVVVDEYQDINGLQERLIQAMVGPETHVTVVGDDDQGIYGWRGAVVDYIINFKKQFADVKTARLEKNFRSTQGIISLANDYIRRNSTRLRKRMVPQTGEKSEYSTEDIQYSHFENEAQQAAFVVQRIRELEGTDFLGKNGKRYALSRGDMAVLIRSNGDIKRFLPFLDEAGIKYVVDSGETVFDQEIVQIAHGLLDYVFAQEDALLPGLVDRYHAFLKRKCRGSVSKKTLSAAITKIRAALDRVAARGKKDYLGDLGLQGVFHDLLHAMGLNSVGLPEPDHFYLAKFSEAISDYEKVWQRLRHSEYKWFRGFVTAWGQHSYAVTTPANTAGIDAVKVMTIHKAKGLEFPVVFAPYLNRKQVRRRTLSFVPETLFDADRYQGNEEDERRVYYVALTRSEKYLFLSGMREDREVKKPREPAPVIRELDSGLLHQPVRLAPQKSGLSPRTLSGYEFATTFSDLAAYGRCGYDYKLRYIYGYNAGVPVAFGYGTQIHNILNLIHKQYRDKPLTAAQLRELVSDRFHLRYAPGNINEHMQKAALKVVGNYVRDHSHEFDKVLETEKSFEMTLGDTLITGQIDLIKKLDHSGTLREVEVVDFKSDTSLLYKVDHDHQLRLYVMACISGLGMNPEKACIHDLETGKKKYVDIDAGSLKKTETELLERIQGIRSERFRPTARVSTCSECDYRKICRHSKCN